LDLITLANNIANSATLIDAGRKGFATRGKEQEGRISYEDGIAEAMNQIANQLTASFPMTKNIVLTASLKTHFTLLVSLIKQGFKTYSVPPD
jgi:hypothetical protein